MSKIGEEREYFDTLFISVQNTQFFPLHLFREGSRLGSGEYDGIQARKGGLKPGGIAPNQVIRGFFGSVCFFLKSMFSSVFYP
jgi:hypothetical protein